MSRLEVNSVSGGVKKFGNKLCNRARIIKAVGLDGSVSAHYHRWKGFVEKIEKKNRLTTLHNRLLAVFIIIVFVHVTIINITSVRLDPSGCILNIT